MVTPDRFSSRLRSEWAAVKPSTAAAIVTHNSNVNIPIFNGFELSARAKEAGLRAHAGSRDVRTAVLNAQMAFQRIAVTRQLLDQSNTVLELAQARYKVGLSGIVDLTQAQLAQTQAEIGYANARYSYQTALAEVRFQTGQ